MVKRQKIKATKQFNNNKNKFQNHTPLLINFQYFFALIRTMFLEQCKISYHHLNPTFTDILICLLANWQILSGKTWKTMTNANLSQISSLNQYLFNALLLFNAHKWNGERHVMIKTYHDMYIVVDTL
jgi:hypothetical protein